MTSTLVLLSYNECDNITLLLPRIPLDLFDRVIAVDGGSDDGTLDVYRQHGIETIVQTRRGRGNAFQDAQRALDTDTVTFFSTDGNENPESLPVMLHHLERGYDMVVAGRYLLDGAQTDDSDDPLRIRKLAGILGGLVVRMIWGSSVFDAINGFRGFSAHALEKLALDAEWHDIELQSTIRAAKLNLSVFEFPTRELTRLSGTYRASAKTATLMCSLGRTILREIRLGTKFTSAT